MQVIVWENEFLEYYKITKVYTFLSLSGCAHIADVQNPPLWRGIEISHYFMIFLDVASYLTNVMFCNCGFYQTDFAFLTFNCISLPTIEH